jgi:hypothetical protein
MNGLIKRGSKMHYKKVIKEINYFKKIGIWELLKNKSLIKIVNELEYLKLRGNIKWIEKP